MKTVLLILISILSLNIYAQSNPNLFSTQFGDSKLTLLREGQGDGDVRILIDASEDILKQCAPDGTFPIATNIFLLEDEKEDGYVLFDTGYGRELWKNLDDLGIKPEEIKMVYLTHMHGDHIGGMLKDGAVAFPDAIVMVAQKEYDHWNAGENTGAKKVLEAYKDQLTIFEPLDLNDISLGSCSIQPIKTYGHTPGHTAFLLHSEGKNLLIWGDLTHAMAVQMPHPEIAVTYDSSPEDAVKFRLEILKFVSKHKISVAGMHIPYRGMGTVREKGEGYEFMPL